MLFIVEREIDEQMDMLIQERVAEHMKKKEGKFIFCLYHLCNWMHLIVERKIAEQMDKLVQERVTECVKTHIPQNSKIE